MAYPTSRNLKDVYLTAYLADVSADSSTFIPVPRGCRGKVIEVGTVLHAAISGG